jgi:hypothetical protein
MIIMGILGVVLLLALGIGVWVLLSLFASSMREERRRKGF